LRLNRLTTAGLIRDKRQALLNEVDDLLIGSTTALYNATRDAIDLINDKRNNISDTFDKSWDIVLMTDGVDSRDAGHISKEDVYNVLPNQESSDAVHIYTVGFDLSNMNEAQREEATEYLRQIAEETNGKYFDSSVGNLADVYTLISLEF